MSGEVQEFGKFIYVEPNDFVAEGLYGDEHKNHHNLTPSYEDYNIEVDLIVNIPDRFGGMTSEKISFFSGNNKYKDIISGCNFLSDVPGSTTYADIVNGNTDGINENLCISNIHITYNSYFIPEITINFTDIRGGALFMINEALYTQDMIKAKEESENKGDSEYSTNTNENSTSGNKIKNFFSSLFHFPYPEFKLQVKGFYGCKVEYSLLVTDFKSSFNSQTGNFDATVKFIGKMYGIHTDIPIEYLFIAPYCKYGSENNKPIWSCRNFELDGAPMPTFSELKEKLLLAKQGLPTQIGYEDKTKYTESKKCKELLQTIKDNFRKLLITHKNVFYGDYKLAIACGTIPHILNDATSAEKIQNDIQKNATNVENFYTNISNDIEEFNNNSFDIKLNNAFKKKISQIGVENKYVAYNDNGFGYSLKTAKIVEETDGLGNTWGEIRSNEVTNKLINVNIKEEHDILLSKIKRFAKTVKSDEDNDQEVILVVLDLKKFQEDLNLVYRQIENEQNFYENKINETANKAITDLLGFKPTISNIFKILMAHLDCFASLYNKLLTNIGTERSKECLKGYKTDVPENNKYLPPFPGIMNGDEFYYPSEIQALQEFIFVDSLFDSVKTYADIKYNVERLEDAVNEGVNFIPTCASDYITNINPYKNIFKNKKYTNKQHLILTFFAYRCISYFIFETVYGTLDEKSDYLKNQKLTPEEFGRLEAYNFFLTNASFSPDEISDITDILSSELNGVSFEEFLFKKDYLGEPNYYKYNEDSNTLLKNNYTGLKLKDNLIYPAVINRDGNGLTSFYKDLAEQSVDYSFKNSYSMPLKYIASIDGEKMEAFRKNLENIKEDNLKDGINKIKNYKYYISRNNFMLNSGRLDETDESNIENITPTPWVFTGNITKTNINIRHNNKQTISNFLKVQEGLCFNDAKRDLALLQIMKGEYTKYMPCFDNPISFLDQFFVNRYYTNYNVYGTTMDVPYRTLLYIGMIMYYILESDDLGSGTIESLIGDVSYFRYGYRDAEFKLNILGVNIPFENFSEKFGFIPFTSIIAILIPILFRKKDGTTMKLPFADKMKKKEEVKEYLSTKYDDDILDDFSKFKTFIVGDGDKLISKNGSAKEFIKLIKENYKDGYVDCLGLMKEYKEWMNSKNPGGFKYFKKHYNLYGRLNFNDLFNLIDEKEKDNSLTEAEKKYEINYNIINKTGGDVYFYDLYSHTVISDEYDTKTYYLGLNKEYLAYNELNKFYNKNKYLIIPYNAYSFTHSTPHKNEIDKNIFNRAFTDFKSKAKDLFVSKNNANKKESKDIFDTNVDDENKLSMYLTLKNLYDKHFYELPKTINKFNINNPNSDYNNIHYIDSLYTDLKDKLYVNLNSVIDVINATSNGYEGKIEESNKLSDLSVYSFMSLLCQKHNMMLLSTPFFCGNMEGQDLKKMFTPNPITNILSVPSYTCFYPHKPSQHLDISNSQYKNDGFNIIPDLNDTQNFEGSYPLSDLDDSENKYKVPAFGIEFGSQKQSIFKDININMDNPQTTEVAVATQFDLIKKKNNESKTLNYYGQDLYKIYANYSYTCHVNMMGCAQIQPLMYFQLNNIPMFRGAYQIIQVEHDITPGNMITSFKGVRINKNKIPITKKCFNLNNISEIIDKYKNIDLGNNNGLEDKPIKEIPKSIENNSDNNNEFNYDEDIIMDTDNLYDYNMFIKDLKNVSFRNVGSYYSNKKEDAFNELNQDLRYILYNIFKRASELYPEMKITITSSTRCVGRNSSPSSDHSVPDVENNRENKASNQRNTLKCNRITLPRKEVKNKTYLTLNGKYYAWVEQIKKYDFYSNEKPNNSTDENTIDVKKLETSLSELGCAVDIITDNQKVDSINLFDLIATEYTNCIRQLIWEVNDATPACQNSISNCIHLASYGQGLANEGGKNDKCEIFVAKTINGKWGSVPAKLPTDIPYSFIETLYNISENDDKYKKIKLNNFNALGHKPTKEELKEWIESYKNQNND